MWGLSNHLDETLIATDDPVPSDAGARIFMKMMHVPKKERETLSRQKKAIGNAILVRRKELLDWRRLCQKRYSGFKAPSWSRWFTFSNGLAKLLVAMMFYLGELASKLFGNSIQLKEDKEPNVLSTRGELAGISVRLSCVDC